MGSDAKTLHRLLTFAPTGMGVLQPCGQLPIRFWSSVDDATRTGVHVPILTLIYAACNPLFLQG